MANNFRLNAPFPPSGDQPRAIEQLVESINSGNRFTTLLGATGTGKTFTVASVIEKINRPALVLGPNKTLVAQLCSEFRDFFPQNAVEYFVSYYDYYHPEAYISNTDTFIEKDSAINDEVDRLRHSATHAVLERRDTLVVASVSCIYGLGSPEDYKSTIMVFRPGQEMPRRQLLKQLVEMQYSRSNTVNERASFRLTGEVLEIHPVDEERVYRIEFFGDEVESMSCYDPLTGEVTGEPKRVVIYPARHYVTPEHKRHAAIRSIEDELRERLQYYHNEGRVLEAQRLEMRTRYDLEMIEEIGYCNGIENYSRHTTGRQPGDAPYTLLDYFPEDFVVFIDESHVTIPQLHGMLAGDRSRKDSLVEHGFRLPSAYDNRPLAFDEFMERVGQIVFVSATPAQFERERSSAIVQQIIRPTGLVDPELDIRPVRSQVDDLLGEIREREKKKERVLVTTLTKKMAEDLTDYLAGLGVRVRYLHSEVDTLGRIQILRDLRLGEFDVLVGINLLREGLDLPEVSLVAILDADQEGFLRSETSLIQTIGRAARNVSGKVILYADRVTRSIKAAMDETQRRRDIQLAYNKEHNIAPRTIRKAVNDILDTLGYQAKESRTVRRQQHEEMEIDELRGLLGQMEQAMLEAARNLEFEAAAAMRDEMQSVKKQLNRKLEGLPIADQIALAAAMEKVKTEVGTARGVVKPEPKQAPKPGEPGSHPVRQRARRNRK
jgi:excinuclease ABC subunit B